MRDYTVQIVSCSKELTKAEAIMFKDLNDADKIEVTVNEIITPLYWGMLHVHNEKARDNQDYDIFVIVAEEGKYYTSSATYANNFADIAEEMDNEPFKVKTLEKLSKNREGKTFFTCAFVV